MLPAVAGFKFKPPARWAYAPEGKAIRLRRINHPDEIGTGIHTLSILRIALKLHFVQNVEPNAGTLVKRQRYLGKGRRFAKVSINYMEGI